MSSSLGYHDKGRITTRPLDTEANEQPKTKVAQSPARFAVLVAAVFITLFGGGIGTGYLVRSATWQDACEGHTFEISSTSSCIVVDENQQFFAGRRSDCNNDCERFLHAQHVAAGRGRTLPAVGGRRLLSPGESSLQAKPLPLCSEATRGQWCVG